MAQNENGLGPRYAIRLGDLQNWHVTTAVCGDCRHKRVMRLWEVKRGQPEHTLLMHVEARLRCRECGYRGELNWTFVSVAKLD